jgi:signal transduction histidine kinase
MYSSLNALKQTHELIDLNTVISEIESDFELLIQQKKAVIETNHLPAISGSSILIYQLFYNLIGNSLKFTRANVDPVIKVSGEVSDEQVKLVVRDNGIGFNQEYGERIFQTFSRLNPKDQFEGTGLGLTLCKNIVERHGGRISAEGRENQGAIFTIMLPNTKHV